MRLDNNRNPEIKIMKGSYGRIRFTFLQKAICENFFKGERQYSQNTTDIPMIWEYIRKQFRI